MGIGTLRDPMKRKRLIQFILVFLTTTACAQNREACNRSVWTKEDAKYLPKEVCIPNSYIISYVCSRYDDIDFNQDGYLDYVFTITKKNQNVGDSTYIVFYEMGQDSVYRLTKKLGNIYPVYFDPSMENPDLKDSNQQRLFDCYGLPDPLYSFDIKSDTISVTRRLDGHNFERILYVYKYNSKLRDWVLISKKKYSENESILYETNSEFLSNFSYCDEP